MKFYEFPQEDELRVLVGSMIRDFRVKKGLTQEDLADLTDLHRNYISNIERGLHSISLYNFYRISIVLEVSTAELFAKLP